MQIILTPDQMRLLEQAYFSGEGVSSTELMHTAASAMVRAMDERGLVRGKRIAFICGSGGNGGDGLAAAAICSGMDADCAVVLAKPAKEYAGDAAFYLKNLPPQVNICSLDEIDEPDVWVDALFGIGLNRDITGFAADCIARMNRSPGTIVSADIPSGVDGRTGDILGCAAEANLTVTFQYPKLGHFLRHGMDRAGELVVCDIGIPRKYLQSTPLLNGKHHFLLRPEDGDIAAMLPRRRHFSHKNSHGHLLLIAGSMGMAGAAAMAARAALHSGVGLLTIACPAEIIPILQTLAPEAMCVPLTRELPFTGKTAVAIGPGLGSGFSAGDLSAILSHKLPAVIDADALRALSGMPDPSSVLFSHCLLTPHPGEARRLISSADNEISDALALHALGGQVIYKGAASIIATDDGLYLSDTGSPCMAKGGSGDALTGIAGALLARGLSAQQAAIAASHIHGRAGEIAERRFGKTYPTAMDLIACLPEVWQALEQ